jgi:hypothetical protein
MSSMATVAMQTPALPQAPRLRLLPRGSKPDRHPCERRTRVRAQLGQPREGRPVLDERPVLLAGGDTAARAAVQRELVESMPARTSFEQAGAVWEVLVRAPASSMVILSGELEDIPAGALMQMITRRHPEVPIVRLDGAAA